MFGMCVYTYEIPGMCRDMRVYRYVCPHTHLYAHSLSTHILMSRPILMYTHIQQIADRVAKHLEIISKTFLTNQNSANGIYD